MCVCERERERVRDCVKEREREREKEEDANRISLRDRLKKLSDYLPIIALLQLHSSIIVSVDHI